MRTSGSALYAAERGVVARVAVEAIGREREAGDADALLEHDRRERAERLGDVRDAVTDVEVEELGPALQLCEQRLDVGAVREHEVLVGRRRELVEHVGRLPAHLLVLPRAAEEDGHVDLVHERDGRERITERRSRSTGARRSAATMSGF